MARGRVGEREIDGRIYILAGRYDFMSREWAEEDAARHRARGASVRIVRMGRGRYADFAVYTLG